MTIPDLLEATPARLTPLLQALQDIQKFHLVEFEGERGTVRLTTMGTRTATVAQKAGIREQAERLLESGGKRARKEDGDHERQRDRERAGDPDRGGGDASGSEPTPAHLEANVETGVDTGVTGDPPSKSNPDETE